MKKLSIIMPVYNATEYIETALQSVIKQTITDMEIICVNDGSTDNSRELLEKYSSKHDNIKIFGQENNGPANARNKGMNEANGEYIAFLDSDDMYLDNNALNKMYEVATKNDADMVSANLRKIRPNGQLEENINPKEAQFTYFTKESVITPEEYGIPWAFYKNIYRREFLQNNNIQFPEKIAGEDPIFLAEILKNLEKIHTLPIDFYGYNHSVGGGLNIKLNTYDKRRDYITHFIEVFNILNDEKFENTVYDYKKEFIDYLNFRQNMDNKDIQKIVSEKFSDDTFFKESDYGYMIIDTIRNRQTSEDDEYGFMKYCLFEESMLEDTFIDIERLKEFEKIAKTSDMDNYKTSFQQLKQIENYTFEEKRQINGKVDRLKIDIARFIKSNNSILNSKSWKITGLLRSIKHNSGE